MNFLFAPSLQIIKPLKRKFINNLSTLAGLSLGGGTLERGKEGRRPQGKEDWGLELHLFWPCGEAGGQGGPLSHTSFFFPQDHQALRNNKGPTQPKPKMHVQSTTMFCIFSPILTFGDDGPVLRLDHSPGSGQLPFPSSTPVVSSLVHLFRPPSTLLPSEKLIWPPLPRESKIP